MPFCLVNKNERSLHLSEYPMLLGILQFQNCASFYRYVVLRGVIRRTFIYCMSTACTEYSVKTFHFLTPMNDKCKHKLYDKLSGK